MKCLLEAFQKVEMESWLEETLMLLHTDTVSSEPECHIE